MGEFTENLTKYCQPAGRPSGDPSYFVSGLRTGPGFCLKTDHNFRNILWSFLRPSKPICAYYLKVGHDRLTAHPLQFIFTKHPIIRQYNIALETADLRLNHGHKSLKQNDKTMWNSIFKMWQASWSSGQSFWLLIMRYRVRFPVPLWGFFLEGEFPLGDHGLGSLVEFRFKAPPGTSYTYITIHLIGTT
jgi:hypothetical protein